MDVGRRHPTSIVYIKGGFAIIKATSSIQVRMEKKIQEVKYWSDRCEVIRIITTR